jgi:hypothetical protein
LQLPEDGQNSWHKHAGTVNKKQILYKSVTKFLYIIQLHEKYVPLNLKHVLISNIKGTDKTKLSLRFHTDKKTDCKNENYMYLINDQWYFDLQQVKIQAKEKITRMTSQSIKLKYFCQQHQIMGQCLNVWYKSTQGGGEDVPKIMVRKSQ